jgi:hypothetical protein
MTVTMGDLLVRERVISQAQLMEALTHQKSSGGRLGDALVALGFIGAGDLERFLHTVPPVPRKVGQTGLSESFLVDLLLKIAYFESDTFSLKKMADAMCLPMAVIDELTELAKAERLVEVRSATGYSRATHVFELTDQGRQQAEGALKHSQYAGPAPVTLSSYNLMVALQSVRQIEVDEAWVREGLAHLVVSEQLLGQLGPAFSSGRSIFLYGPAGTGKSSIAEGLARALSGEVYIPHAIEVDGHVLRVLDPAVHVYVDNGQDTGKQLELEGNLTHDPRWRLCRRPVVMVGGELKLEELNLDYDLVSKFYEAPVQMKAANGVFILDDFGRQAMPPRQLLNRWIVPLERGTDFLALHTGKKFETPFDQITIFCTNLRPSELVDEAFLRRIRHKIKINYQSEAEFLEILRRVCDTQGITYNTDAASYLLDTYYRKTQRPLVGSHPRDLVDQIVDRARFKKDHPELTPDAIDAAAANYFVEL